MPTKWPNYESLTATESNIEENSENNTTDYGSTLDGQVDKRTGNQRAQLIWTHGMKRVYKMSYEEMFAINATFAELLLSRDVPSFREEFLEKRSVSYPLIHKYQSLSNYTLSSLLIACGYFLELKRVEIRQGGDQRAIAQIAQLCFERTVQGRIRKELVNELMARPVPEVVEERGLIRKFFCWKARPRPRRIIPLDMITY